MKNDPAADVRAMSHRDLFDLFQTLEAPALAEMNGEYTATLLRQPSRVADVLGRLVLANPFAGGRWLTKSFRPVSGERGRGYNTFDYLGRTVQRYPMLTLVAASRYDRKPAFQLVYHAYRSLCGDIHMVDEVRRLTKDSYLGIGTWGFTHAQRQIPLPFLLEGPVAAYRGDIGKERKAFDLASEVPGLGSK